MLTSKFGLEGFLLLLCVDSTNGFNITKDTNGVLVSSYIPTFSIMSTFEQINETHLDNLEVDIHNLLKKSKKHN